MSTAVAPLPPTFPAPPKNPALLGWPATLPLELALKTASPRAICEAYHIEQAEWELLRNDPRFIADVGAAVALLRKEGMTFTVKAGMQAEAMLKEIWVMAHDRSGATPPSVRADLMKFIIRASGNDKSMAAAVAADAARAATLNIQINLG